MAMSPQALATTVGRPRRSGAASSTSSWTSVAEWMSSTATAARRTPSFSSPAARGEEPEQRPQPLSPGTDRAPGVRGEHVAVEGGGLLQALLQPLHQRRDVRSAGLDEREDLLGAAHRTVPESRDDAAGGQDPADVVEPAAAIRPASASGPGKRSTELGR